MNRKWTMKMRSSELPDWSLRVQSTGVEVRRACLMQKHYATSRVVKIIRSMEEKYICQRSWDCCRKAITRSASMDLTISGTWDHKNKQTDRTTSAVIIITSILVAGAMKWTTLGWVCVCVCRYCNILCIYTYLKRGGDDGGGDYYRKWAASEIFAITADAPVAAFRINRNVFGSLFKVQLKYNSHSAANPPSPLGCLTMRHSLPGRSLPYSKKKVVSPL